MDKTKTSKKQKASLPKMLTSKAKEKRVNKKKQPAEHVLKKGADLKEYNPMKTLLDTNILGAAIMECLIENDTEGVLEIIEGYLYALNKTQFLKEANIPRSTAYNFIRRRNPTIKTLAKIIHASAHAN